MSEVQTIADATPSATGVLARTPLAHLYIYLSERRLTGTLVLRPADGPEASLYIREGHALRIHTTEPAHYLGRVLTDLGYINEHQLRISLDRLKAERKQHGQILIESGFISAAQLADGLLQQANRKLRAIFRLAPATTYAYYAAADFVGAASTDSPIAIDLLPVTWRAINEYPNWDTVHATIQRVGGGKMHLAHNADLARCEFLHDESAAALALKTSRSIDELAGLGLLDARTCDLLVYFLMITKQVEVFGSTVGDQDASSLRFSRSSSIPSGPPSTPGSTGSNSAPSGAHATAPVSGSRPSSLDLLVPPSGPASTPSGVTLSASLDERRIEVARIHDNLENLDYFALMGLPRTAVSADVSKAFVGLAKRWHPDRLSAEFAELRGAYATVFARISEAHGTLSNDEQRAAYLARDPKGSSASVDAAVASSLTAAAAHQKAEFFLARGDLSEAETLARRALELDPQAPEIQSLVAWIDGSRAGASERAVEEAIARLSLALEASETLEKALCWRGALFKKLGRLADGIADYKRAFDLNPNNIDAAREVRLYHMRQSKDDPSGGAVPSSNASTNLLRRLMKK